ncbi:trans-sulfuration enzyme family protein [Bacillus marinisedimentorum]|uniref:trans-sulfuration enzyme family protein n=1 Tax=Bacillus marinisedimentorum TaxID=1821260 RepID=UPI0008721708|nr:aminotransferase class I/II-fold pyridoxal phosphate-dependent enzyme [Bacillus marinisedimentorum]
MELSFGTKLVHQKFDQEKVVNSKTTPIYQTSAFTFNSLQELEAYYSGESSYLYSRNGNPNPDELGQTAAALENAPAGAAASSGMSAILAGILSITQQGDHIVAAEDLYGGTFHLLSGELSQFGIEASFVDFSDKQAVEAAIRPNTRLLYSETISNPFLRVEDLQFLVETGKKHRLRTMVDNTFATPFLLQPYGKGIDLVVHSATKYIGGHSDVTAGVLAGGTEIIQLARQKIVSLGANLSPFEAWLTQRGIKTLALRMAKQCENAAALASALKEHEYVKRVYYPEQVSERGRGAIVTIELEEHVDVDRFFKSLGWIKIVPTLAGVETTVSYPLTTSHRALSHEQRERIGVNERVVRISAGIEEAGDITAQFEAALAEVEA